MSVAAVLFSHQNITPKQEGLPEEDQTSVAAAKVWSLATGSGPEAQSEDGKSAKASLKNMVYPHCPGFGITCRVSDG